MAASPTYPVGCGVPACRTCRPIPGRQSLPESPGESVLSLLVAALGLLLFIVAFGYLLLAAS